MFYKSDYNFFYSVGDNRYIGFNSFTGAIVLMSQSEMDIYNSSDYDSEVELWNELKRQGFIVNDKDFQYNKIIECRNNFVQNRERLFFRILPTTNCNARCEYCYEYGIKHYDIEESMIPNIISFIDNEVKKSNGKTKKIGIQYYGGEPLLQMNFTKKCTKELKEYFEKQHIGYFFTMISNGILIKKENIIDIKNQMLIRKIQITLDGFGEEYSNRKKYVNKIIDPFAKIIENIELCLNNGIKIDIRLNLDGKNYNNMLELVDYLCDRFKGFKGLNVYAHPLYGKEWPNETPPSDEYITPKQLFTIVSRLYYSKLIKIPRFTLKKGMCGAVHPGCFDIMPNGELLKCLTNTNNPVGDIYTGVNENSNYLKWTDTKINPNCQKCKFLPLCQGGCKAGWLGEIPTKCFVYKNIFKDVLMLITDLKTSDKI